MIDYVDKFIIFFCIYICNMLFCHHKYFFRQMLLSVLLHRKEMLYLLPNYWAQTSRGTTANWDTPGRLCFFLFQANICTVEKSVHQTCHTQIDISQFRLFNGLYVSTKRKVIVMSDGVDIYVLVHLLTDLYSFQHTLRAFYGAT